MKAMILTAALAALTLAAAPSLAKQNCPPGLAKKAVPCVPPGLAKKGVGQDRGDYFRIGDEWIHEDDLIRIRDYDRYRLRRLRENEAYYRNGTFVFRVDEQTRRVIELIRLADLVLSN